MDWIKVRLNRDNFWNVLFWLGMTAGMAVSQYFSTPKGLFIISICITLIVVPLITKLAQGVKFDKEYGFLTSTGRSLTNSMPKYWGTAAFLSIGLVYILLFFVIAPIFFYYSMAVLFVTLYFVLINCPISILFNKDAYQVMSAYELKNMRNSKHINSPLYSYMSCNIYNHHRNKRY